MNGLTEKFSTRSLGVKLIVVCALALLILIPTLFVDSLITERTNRAKSVANDISRAQGGAQTLLGPTLAIPYTYESIETDLKKHFNRDVYFVSPIQAETHIEARTTELHRSLFKVPVYKAEIVYEANFDLTGVPANAPEGAAMEWNNAELLIGATDPRGALSDPSITVGGHTSVFVPARTISNIALSENGNGLSLFGVMSETTKPGAIFHVTARMNLSGAQAISVLPYGKSSTVTMKSDWPNPGFDGGFLPVTRTITDHGFDAAWSVPFIARGVRSEGSNVITPLTQSRMNVNFVELVDPYQSVERALKYVLLFVGMVFCTFFIFETVSQKRIHPAQYILIGIAQVIFYLLLLSIAERVGFDWAFLISAVATVGLIASYAGWIFESRKRGSIALAVFSLLYGLIYLLMRLEDQALLIGSLSSFAIVAAVMFFTRHIDWYNPVAAVETKQDDQGKQ